MSDDSIWALGSTVLFEYTVKTIEAIETKTVVTRPTYYHFWTTLSNTNNM